MKQKAATTRKETDKKEADKKKYALLNEIYYDLEDGFASREDTYQKAKAADPSITKAEVREFLARQKILQKKDYKLKNSFVPRETLQEIQIDLGDFQGFGNSKKRKQKGATPEEANSKFRYGMFAIDIFSNKLTVIPLVDKTSEETAEALAQVIEQDIGIPITVHTDLGGASFKVRSKEN